MLDRLPEDVIILIVDGLQAIHIVRSFRLISRRYNQISRLPVIWARICLDYSILSPSGLAVNRPDCTIASIAHIDDNLAASGYRCKSIFSIPFSRGSPYFALASPGGKHVVVACEEGYAMFNIAERTSRLLSSGPLHRMRFSLCMAASGSGDNEKLFVAYKILRRRRNDVCELLCIDIHSRPEHAIAPITAMRFERRPGITGLALFPPFLALGWRSHVDVYDFTTNKMHISLQLPGRIQDIVFADPVLLVLHSNPPSITAFNLISDNDSNVERHSVAVSTSDDIGLRWDELRFVNPASPIIGTGSTPVFLDLVDGTLGILEISCSPWSKPINFPNPFAGWEFMPFPGCRVYTSSGSHHIMSRLENSSSGQASIIHTRMSADGSLVSNPLRLEAFSAVDLGGADSPMAWDEKSGRLFIARCDEWGQSDVEEQFSLIVIQL